MKWLIPRGGYIVNTVLKPKKGSIFKSKCNVCKLNFKAVYPKKNMVIENNPTNGIHVGSFSESHFFREEDNDILRPVLSINMVCPNCNNMREIGVIECWDKDIMQTTIWHCNFFGDWNGKITKKDPKLVDRENYGG